MDGETRQASRDTEEHFQPYSAIGIVLQVVGFGAALIWAARFCIDLWDKTTPFDGASAMDAAAVVLVGLVVMGLGRGLTLLTRIEHNARSPRA